MAPKLVYLRILHRYASFRMKKVEYKSMIFFIAAVTQRYQYLADRCGKPKSTMAHLIASLGFQLLNEIEQEEGMDFIKNVLDCGYGFGESNKLADRYCHSVSIS